MPTQASLLTKDYCVMSSNFKLGLHDFKNKYILYIFLIDTCVLWHVRDYLTEIEQSQ